MAANKNDLDALIRKHFSCNLCSAILYDPVQCEKEHYFCRKCIPKHLCKSKTCPTCLEKLTLVTLRASPRIVADFVSQLKKIPCGYVARGCEKKVRVQESWVHRQTRAFAPVNCSNQGTSGTKRRRSEETVSRRDQETHEHAKCKFRKVTYERSSEQMVYRLHEKHLCALRKEMDDMKVSLGRVTRLLTQTNSTQARLEEKALRKEMDDMTVSLDRVTRLLTQMNSTQARRQEKPDTSDDETSDEESADDSLRTLPRPIFTSVPQNDDTTASVVKGKIFAIGDFDLYSGRSIEIFDWSTMTWTLLEKCLHKSRSCAIAFFQGEKLMIYGGTSTWEIECLSPSEDGFTSTLLPGRLGDYNCINGIRCGNRVLNFHQNVREAKIEAPHDSKVLLYELEGITRLRCPVVRCGEGIYIIGGQPSTLECYDVARNKMEHLPPVPYHVSRMSAVVYKDNIIILGGEGDSRNPLDDVVMFNVTTQKYTRLPSMLEKRACSSAVILGNTVVVMGGTRGRSRKNCTSAPLKSVECYVIGEDAWKKMPDMNRARAWASACVYEQ